MSTNKRTMEIHTITLPAHWAPALINGDWSGLDQAESAQVKTWLAESGLDVLSCDAASFVARFNGLVTECLDYHCTLTGAHP